MTIAFYIISGFILFAILWLANKAILSLIAAEKIHPAIQRIFPVVEFFLWFLYIIWALRGIFSYWHFYNILMYSVIVSIIIGVAWFIAKDFLAGIVLKSEVPFQKDQRLSLPQATGKLKKLGYRSLEIEADNGQVIKIPYSRLTSEIITCHEASDGLKGYETIVTIKNLDVKEDAGALITKKIMLLPWTIALEKPVVTLLDDESKPKNRYSVKFFAANPKHASKIIQHIKESFEKK